MLKWIHNYIEERSIKVRVDRHFSETGSIEAGVPQGGVCSPMEDMPASSEEVQLHIYADDITITCSATNVEETKANMQRYLNKFSKWCREWGLCINPGKTYLQMFTRKRVSIPILRINDKVIEHVKEKRLLGLILDAPRLTWSAHINYLKINCMKRVSLMKTFASTKWGASMVIMRQFYISYIQAKINYGSVVYASSAGSYLQKLDIIQNACMRMILGARRSTPILSLQAESHIPPLQLKRNYLLVKEYMKLMFRPKKDYTCWCLGICEGDKASPFNEKTKKILEQQEIKDIVPTPTRLISQIPPWEDITTYIIMNTEDQAMQNNHTFQDYRENNWTHYQFLYTDGSKRYAPEVTVACGLYIEQGRRSHCWKLRPEHSIISAELYAILKALQYIEIYIREQNCVVFTDSLSALQLIIGVSTKYIKIINEIQRLLLTLNSTRRVILHWVKSHSGIMGNECADRVANLGHDNNRSENYKLTKEEWYSVLKSKFTFYWNKHWQDQIRLTNKGVALLESRTSIQQKIPITTRNRRLEIVIYRLRMGHVGLAKYLHRFNMKDTEQCESCFVPETVQHFLLYCSRYATERQIMFSNLRKMGVMHMTLRCLLGGEQKGVVFNRCVLNQTMKYITMTGRLDSL